MNLIYTGSEEDENMGSKTGSGKVSAQAQTGETVTITVKNSSNIVVGTLTALTDSTGGFSAVFTGDVGTYTATANIPADTQYSSAISPVTTFTLTATQRTITLTWA